MRVVGSMEEVVNFGVVFDGHLEFDGMGRSLFTSSRSTTEREFTNIRFSEASYGTIRCHRKDEVEQA